jgi:hypothetical protein
MTDQEPELDSVFTVGETRQLLVDGADVDVTLVRRAGEREARHYTMAATGIDATIMISRRAASDDARRLAQLARLLSGRTGP